MNNLIKLALPILNSEITKKDIDSNTGFYGAYFDDKNRPWLTNHMFLLYDLSSTSVEQNRTFYKFKNLANLHSIKYITVNNKTYKEFIFTSNSTVNKLSEGIALLTNEQRLQILKFWNFTDKWINYDFLGEKNLLFPEEVRLLESVPEEDYIENDYLSELDEQKMGSGITIDTTTH